MAKISALLSVLAASTVAAHPGATEDIKQEMALRSIAQSHASRALSACASTPQARSLQRRAASRRATKALAIRDVRGLAAQPLGHQKRDMDELLAYMQTSHNQTGHGAGAAAPYTALTPETTVFGSNNTCALVPETTIGPYYVLGESIRTDITEGQGGVPLHIEMQFVDMDTCLPVPAVAADVWHCNSTGTYSGVEAEDTLDETFLRGVQISDDDGVVAFDSLFPGHYANRVTHFHIVAQANVTVLENATYTGGVTKHVGQLYFDDALVKAVEANLPYSTNTIAYTDPTQDGWMLEEATADYDPFVEYVQLGSDINDGVLAWITIALNTTADHADELDAAAHYYADGGVVVESNGMGSGPSNPCAVGPGSAPTCTITPTGETLAAKV